MLHPNPLRTCQALYQAHRGVLSHSYSLIQALTARYGPTEAAALYANNSGGNGTLGQHIRHVLDHSEPVITVATESSAEVMERFGSSLLADMDNPQTCWSSTAPPRIQYDRRERGGTDEHDWEAARARLDRVDNQIHSLLSSPLFGTQDEDYNRMQLLLLDRPVKACFLLNGTDDTEYDLSSTLSRELGFAAHHAIHHLATIKMIATSLDVELPGDFGRAPSTVHHDRTQQATTND